MTGGVTIDLELVGVGPQSHVCYLTARSVFSRALDGLSYPGPLVYLLVALYVTFLR